MNGVTKLYDEARIAGRIQSLAGEIAAATPGERGLVLLVLLKGAFVFAADLVRALDRAGLAPEVEFLVLSSYGAGTESSGEIRMLAGSHVDLADRDVLVVDDILDTGRSLRFALDWAGGRGARRVRTCVLLDKPSRRVIDIRADFVGFEIPNRFVVGYGVDHAERWRHLPYIGYVDPP